MNLFKIAEALERCVKLVSGNYVDTETGEIREKRASAVLPLLAAVFFILAVVGLAAVL